MSATELVCADVYRVDYTYSFLSGVDYLRPPSSIVIPQKDLEMMAGMERQYWEIKSKYFDVLIFFKKGKFYELYDQDAAIAHREFGLKLVFDTTNRGKMRLAGVPEQSFSEWARLFVFRGYKVGRVEQMKEVTASSGSLDKGAPRAKLVPRELVEVLTPGTITDLAMLSGSGPVFILALLPLQENAVDAMAVDLSRRVVYHCPCGLPGQNIIRGDVFLMVSALLQQLCPREIIFPRSLLASSVGAGGIAVFANRLVEWIEGDGFRVELVDTSETSCLHSSSAGAKSFEAASEFLAHHFKKLKLTHAEPILSEAKPYSFHLPQLPHQENATPANHCESINRLSSILWHERKEDRGLVLDATTVSNFELATNLRDGGERGSLNQLLNRCCTNGGKRLFRSWILRPSASCRVITARQEAVRFILEHRLEEMWGEVGGEAEVVIAEGDAARRAKVEASEVVDCSEPQFGVKRERPMSNESDFCCKKGSGDTFEARFGNLVNIDFERNLSRLADLKNDNDAQVAFVNPLVQYKKHLQIILTTVQAYEEMVWWSRSIQKVGAAPALLKELWGNIDAAAPSVTSIGRCFDRDAAVANGIIVPSRGTSLIYDEASDRLDTIEAQLHEKLCQLQKDVFGGATINFTDIGHDHFLVEVPICAIPKKIPAGFVERARSGRSVKYTVGAFGSLVEAHKKAKVDKSNGLLSVLRNIASHICSYFPVLYAAAEALSYFDCLLSLARLYRQGLATSWPVVEYDNAGARVLATRLTHPFLTKDSVPNNIHLDAARGRILVLTGPNMAGKSTLMRTVAVNVIIAQMGGPIFGESMHLAIVSRIFTRIGARDASHKGQSTLYVELSETADILHYANEWSLCLVDELGRGTSTHDGYAIAYATLLSLKSRLPVSPLVLFSTHYHALAQEQVAGGGAGEEVSASPHSERAVVVQLGYMDFALSDSKSDSVPAITFLYRLVPGICTRSYGVEVALLAGIPSTLVNTATIKSRELASWNDRQKNLCTIRGFLDGDMGNTDCK